MRLIFLLCLLFVLPHVVPDATVSEKAKSILQRSSAFHDPGNNWDGALLNFHIEEPRVQNPTRYSEIFLNMADGTFSLVRNREDHLATYIMDANGTPMVLLDGNEAVEEEMRARYRLYPDRVANYRNFYKVMYGLPMSVKPSSVRRFEDVKEVQFEGQPSLAVTFEWKESIIQPKWTLYVSKANYQLLGVDMFNDQGEGERIVFRGLVDYSSMRLPHMRHWYSLDKTDYLGSDIILSSEKF